MAGRKEKTTLDFIQIDCLDKTTFKRLNRKFSKEGRLFWIDLLRLLGRTEWYILDLSDNDILEDIMIDELDISKGKGIEILNQLAKWGVICENTWLNHRNIWCQKLIDRHIEVFKKRRKIPVNPFSNVIYGEEMPIKAAEIPIKVTEMQQSKVKESKGNKTKENNTIERSKNALEYLKNSDFNYLDFEMKNKKNVKEWDLMMENYNYKVDEEGINYDVKVLESRLRRWMNSWIRYENRYPDKFNQKSEQTSKVKSNLNELERARQILKRA